MFSIFIHILIVAAASAAGFGAACWLLNQADRVKRARSEGVPGSAAAGEIPDTVQLQLSQLSGRLSALLLEMETLKSQLAAARSEALQYKREAASASSERDEARTVAAKAQEALGQLQGLASRITTDVATHRAEMQEVSSRLRLDASPQTVLDAVAKLLSANEKMRSRLEQAEARLREQERIMEAQMLEARTDALTGLLNRRAFDSEMSKLEKAYHEHRRPSSVMMIDVDHFKKFNDTYGHQAGDQVLKEVAAVLKGNVSGNALVCRYGGEEFAVIFPGSDLATARPAAERARAAVAERTCLFEGKELRVTASAGVAEFYGEEDAASLVKRADEALYACKQAGRNCGHYHDGQAIHPMTPRLLQKDTPTREKPADAPPVPSKEPASSARDTLTGLSNRQVFTEDLDRRLAAWRRGGPDLSVVLIEIDRFERLCDAFGQAAGDLMLKATSQFLRAALRDMDHVARFGDKQFALLLPNSNIDNAQLVAERLRLAIQKCKLPVNGGVLQFTISAGVAQAIMNDSTESLLARAGQLLTAALSMGGDTVVATLEPVAVIGSTN